MGRLAVWMTGIAVALGGCSPLAGPFGSSESAASTGGDAGTGPTSCVYEDSVSSTCSTGATPWTWACADYDCSLVDFGPQVSGNCQISFQVATMESYPGSCAEWGAAGSPTTGGDPASGSATSGTSSGSLSGATTGSGDCLPPAALSLTATWHPPVASPGACTATQLQSFAQECDSTASCAAFLQANTTCGACLVSASTSPSWGPLVSYGGAFLDQNLGGCIAQLDPTQIQCGQAVQAFAECIHAACDASCDASDTGFTSAYQGCETEAVMGACASAESAASCAAQLTAPSSACLDPSSGLATILSAFCG